MLSQQIRRAFLQYFKKHGHTIIPSSPVIPHDDPTLLFINAGMNQFKDVFLGTSKRDYTRATTTQKCIRVGGKHNDLDNVGHTSRHLTFFEMLGNFSFGDYFKKEAIGFAWEVATGIFGFEPEKIWVSVYKDDDEAFALWEKHMPAKRLVRFGEKENFWAMGDTGPCGPCSELLYDRGDQYGFATRPEEDPSGERYLEFWNLVFMQYERGKDGSLTPLPKQSIDTGSGLERVASLKLGVESVFQTDILRDLIAETENLSKKSYDPKNHALAPAFHVIADHVRSLSFAIADGVQPSNTDRGYVLRKILRRAVRYGRMLGFQKPFLAQIFPRLVNSMGEDFPELKSARARIEEILTTEEEAFFRTLQRGGNLLSQVMHQAHESRTISGEDAFKLKDTYGFPVEEILLIAKDEGLQVDLPRFEQLEEGAKEKSRKAHKKEAQQFDPNLFSEFAKTHPCKFVGYDHQAIDAHIQGIVSEGRFVERLEKEMEGMILLDATCFYAEMGGQVGDTGFLQVGDNVFQVLDTTTPFPGVIAHVGKIRSGHLKNKEKVHARIDQERRQQIQSNHTATHLLHWALEQVLGSHIKQAGSLVEPNRIRFDFSHHKPLSLEEIRSVEEKINGKIRTDGKVNTYQLSYEEAQKRNDVKQFFGEKYGSEVRVVDLDFSKELCGGTHTRSIGTIGLFKISKESSIAAGVRRIEAVTGRDAELFVEEAEDLIRTCASTLKVSSHTLLEKIQSVLDDNRRLTQELKAFRRSQRGELVKSCVSHKEIVGSISLVAELVDVDAEDLVPFAEELLEQLKSGVVAVGATFGDKCQLLVAVSSDLVQKNVQANLLIKEAAPLIQGGGGGRPSLAQAGGKDPKGLSQALNKIRHLLTQC